MRLAQPSCDHSRHGGGAARRLRFVVVLAWALSATPALATTPKLYVLKHPGREHCAVHWIRSSQIVVVNARKVRQVVCRRLVPAPPLIPPVIGPGATTQFVRMPRAAAKVAQMIRRDARREYYSGRVRVVRRDDGVRVIRVHYGMKPQPPVTGGEYVLRLEETIDRRLIGVGVEESSTATDSSDGQVSAGGSTDMFAMRREGMLGLGPWRWSFTHLDHSATVSADGERFGVAGSFAVLPTLRLPRADYLNVLHVLRSAPSESLVGLYPSFP